MDSDFEWLGSGPAGMIDDLLNFEEILIEEISEEAEDLADSLLDDTQDLAPVDTGELRDSYEREIEEVLEAIIEVRVVTRVEHAPYQEFMDIGTPHVGPALEKNKSTFEDAAERAWNSAVRRIS
ncbi:HK97 gp10 family phage protein [Halorubrum trueperi]|uniref:HK97 gp10 family phage protein n=1 Tax=Halorubrum trueperi TaxID=2004704 RepID=A0ABD5UJC0_9EURY